MLPPFIRHIFPAARNVAAEVGVLPLLLVVLALQLFDDLSYISYHA